MFPWAPGPSVFYYASLQSLSVLNPCQLLAFSHPGLGSAVPAGPCVHTQELPTSQLLPR